MHIIPHQYPMYGDSGFQGRTHGKIPHIQWSGFQGEHFRYGKILHMQ